MFFNSFQFLLFFPIVVLLYYVIGKKIRWIWLLIASYFFYMSWNVKFLVIILAITFITYLSGIFISKAESIEDEERRIKLKKLSVAFSFIFSLGILFFFKYYDFAIDNINEVLDVLHLRIVIPSFDILMPVGLSFYTLQALSYSVDVYRGDTKVERNFGKYALFVSFFPQLVSGPISKSKDLLKQFDCSNDFDYLRVKNGLLIMLWGFFQKLVIADRIAVVVNSVYNNYTSYSGSVVIVASILYAFQIYCDFSSYSDMARGAAQVMGIDIINNFDRPYFSKSIAEFWRRWHRSLGGWFRDYLYFPLGGSRKGNFKRYRNIMIVFLASGLWHGASWNFVIWGFLHGAYQIIGYELKPVRNKLLEITKIEKGSFLHKIIQILTVFILVDFAWIFFRANSFSQATYMIKSMFIFNPWVLFDGTMYTLGLDEKDFLVGVLSIIFLIIVSLYRRDKSVLNTIEKQNTIIRWIMYFSFIFFIIIFGMYGPGAGAQEFIYFQF